MYISRHWRWRKAVWVLIVLEFIFTVAGLTLFGIADPNTYRTKLWQEGGDLGYNSSPSTLVYAYANYKPVTIPLVWSSFMTTWNLVISVLSMFILLCKVTMFVLHIFYPLLSVVVHAGLIAIWGYSIYAQTAPDTIDPDHVNHGAPWYITKSCSVASTKTLEGYCMQAKSAFAVTIVMFVSFVAYFLISLYSCYPTPEQKAQHAAKKADEAAAREKEAELTEYISPDPDQHWQQQQQQWEMHHYPRSPYATMMHDGFHPYQQGPAYYPQHDAPYTPGTTTGAPVKSPVPVVTPLAHPQPQPSALMTPRTLAFRDLEGGKMPPLERKGSSRSPPPLSSPSSASSSSQGGSGLPLRDRFGHLV